ncbi:MAG TPA: arginase [Myxococcales bacterium]|jgi:agmatinase|nr:arginase [Myxococcales bacterium]
MSFDPNAAASPESGLFGLDCTDDEARVVILPVPFDATTSYGKGSARGPEAILEASKQVDLYDLETGRPYEAGIALYGWPRKSAASLRTWNREATRFAQPVIAAAGVVGSDRKLQSALAQVNELSEKVNALVRSEVDTLIRRGKIVGLLGGDHATPFGSIEAHARAYPGMGVLHIDAHADLRRAFEGFVWSHASIMFNVVERLPGVKRLVQVGIRDFCEEELEVIKGSRGRVVTHFDLELARGREGGTPWLKQCSHIVKELPEEVYVSFDIDGLDPALCPHTGTPVPGGLSFNQACLLIGEVVRSGRRIVGFDLNEVAPGPKGDEWDANVGARILYKLLGWALVGAERPRAKGRKRK